MKSRKGLGLIAVILFTSLFVAYRTSFANGDEKIVEQRQKLLTLVGTILSSQHFSPKKIDDQFSKAIFKKYFEQLDGDKSIFLQSDIQSLKKFELLLDDELKGAPIQFEPAVSIIYDKRFPEAQALYREILSKPFNFTVVETYHSETEKLQYPKNAEERRERWRKRLKLSVLERYADLLETREKNKGNKDFEIKSDAALEAEARDRVLKTMDRMYDRIKNSRKEDQRFHLYINTITELMDPHTNYFPPVEKRYFDEQMSGRFFGIGAQLREEDAGIKIVSLVTGGPAWKSNQFVVGDIIVKVGQGDEEMTDITGYSVDEAVKLIRGAKGTTVKLTLKKQDGTFKTVSLVRDEIVQDEAFARSAVIQKGNEKVGYIYLPDFYADFEDPKGHRCSEDVARELEKLKEEKVDAVVVDLRNNGGGSLYEVIQMVGLFIPHGPVVQVKDKDGRPTVLNDKDVSTVWDGPLVVMINELSASASEIFAGAIQDYNRGIIIGSSSTFGKGTVQRNIPIGKPLDLFSGRTDMGALKLTFQKFYRISGASNQLKGVVPDIIVPDTYEYLKIREKDYPECLAWDEVTPVKYQEWGERAALNELIERGNKAIATDPVFSVVSSNIKWLADNLEKPIELNLVKYQEQQKSIRSTITQNNGLLKLKDEMRADCTESDKEKFYNNPDKAKGERYQAWLQALKTDIYVYQSCLVAKSMIGSKVSTANR